MAERSGLYNRLCKCIEKWISEIKQRRSLLDCYVRYAFCGHWSYFYSNILSMLNTLSVTIGIDPNRLVALMGHASKQMIYEVYGKYTEGLEKDRQGIKEYFGDGFK